LNDAQLSGIEGVKEQVDKAYALIAGVRSSLQSWPEDFPFTKEGFVTVLLRIDMAGMNCAITHACVARHRAIKLFAAVARFGANESSTYSTLLLSARVRWGVGLVSRDGVHTSKD
jgi:hypothetical protein